MPAENVCRKFVAVPATLPEVPVAGFPVAGFADAFAEGAKLPPPQATVQTKAERRMNKHKGANFKRLLPIFFKELGHFYLKRLLKRAQEQGGQLFPESRSNLTCEIHHKRFRPVVKRFQICQRDRNSSMPLNRT